MSFGRELLKKESEKNYKSFLALTENVAGLGVEPSLRDYEPHVHRTLSRALLLKNLR